VVGGGGGGGLRERGLKEMLQLTLRADFNRFSRYMTPSRRAGIAQTV